MAIFVHKDVISYTCGHHILFTLISLASELSRSSFLNWRFQGRVANNNLLQIVLLVKSKSSFNRGAVTVTVKVAFWHILLILPHIVPCWFISSDDICTLHATFFFFSSSNAKNRAFFPHNLREMTCSSIQVSKVELISWNTDLVVPKIDT